MTRNIFLLLVYILFTIYFCYSLFNGPRSYGKYIELQGKIRASLKNQTKLSRKQQKLLQRVEGLELEHLDADLCYERCVYLLNFAKPNDYIAFLDAAN